MTEININEDGPFHYNHARPNVAVDICSIGIIKGQFEAQNESSDNSSSRLVVFITRKKASDPWGLPGGYMHFAEKPGRENETKDGETIETAIDRVKHREWPAYREIAGRVINESMKYEVPINDDFKVQARVLDRPDRDPRGRVLSIPIVTFVGFVDPKTIPEELSHVARWVPLDSNFGEDGDYPLAYDHPNVIPECYHTLLTEARTRVIGRNLVNEEEFDLQDLIDIYDLLFNKRFERSNFRKQFVQKEVIISTLETPIEEGKRRTCERFRFNNIAYEEYKKNRDFAFNPRSNKDKK